MTRLDRRFRAVALMGTTLGFTLLLAACGGDGGSMAGMDHGGSTATSLSSSPTASPSGTAAAGPHNAADSAFATDMVGHHAQAVAMSDLLLAKDDVDPAVVKLAQQIKAAQAPEIEQMRGWLGGWGEPVPAADGAMDMGGAGHDMESMGSTPGMMSDADMARLADATGADRQRLYLEQMVAHHHGAITMSRTELRDGENPDAKELAQTIIATQRSEVTTMTELLAG